MIGRRLIQSDLKALAGCGISAETAQAAGLRRVSSEEGAQLVGRKDNGTYAGVAYPYLLPGETTPRAWRLRRDSPDIEQREDGPHEKAKYLSAPGESNKLYFPPLVTAAEMAAIEIEILITEGEKKTLAVAEMSRQQQLGILPIGISGVYNWLCTTAKTSGANGQRQAVKGALPDFARFQWTGRKTYIAFDRDASTNYKVRSARFKLAQSLTRRGARVYFVEISADSPHKGIDDLIGAEGAAAALALIAAARPANGQQEVDSLITAQATLTDGDLLRELTNLIAPMNAPAEIEARAAVRKSLKDRLQLPDLDRMVKDRRQWVDAKKRAKTSAAELTYSGKQYEESASGLLWWRPGQNGHSAVTLSNFGARIVADVVRDDGQEKTRALKVSAHVGPVSQTFTISAQEFGRMEWPIEHMGARAIVYPGFRDHLRTAIQTLSDTKEEHHTYLHTGWTKVEDQFIYMHSAGGISAKGNDPALVVELPAKLAAYKLPDPPQGKDLLHAIDAALHTLTLAPPKFTYPLFSAVWRAVLGPVDCSLFLAGQTGTGKSEIAAIMQQFFGAGMNAKNLPAGWESTANALESLAHTIKNAIMIIDDFVPRGGSNDVNRLNQVADRILRGQGNASGRTRMSADTTIRAPKSPRGLIVGTGEDVPRGHSLRARLIILEFGLEDLNWQQLTTCQAEARQGLYAEAMAAFIQWIAPKMADMPARVESVLADYRARWNTQGHKRTPGNLANLAVGLELFLEFAIEAGALSAKAANFLRTEAEEACYGIAREQAKQQEHGEPVQQFLDTINAAITSGAAHLAAPDGGQPEEPARWGWRADPSDLSIWRPQGARIGWTLDDDIYIEPQSAYKVANHFHGATGETIAISLATLKRRLKQQSKLASTDVPRESVTIRRRVEGASREVLHFYESLGHAPRVENSPDIPNMRQTGGKCRNSDESENEQYIFPDTRFQELTNGKDNHLTSNVGNVGKIPHTRAIPAAEGNGSENRPVSHVGKTKVGFSETPENPDSSRQDRRKGAIKL